jgi:hypothetical protein
MIQPVPNQHLESSFQVNPQSTNLIVFGMPRSASTYVWQVMSDIFEIGVVRTHVYFDVSRAIPLVRTIRDWRDAIVSYWRSHQHKRNKKRPPLHMAPEDIFQYVARYQQFIWTLKEWTIIHPDSPVVRYEDVIKTPEALFKIAEDLGGPEVPPTRRAEILAAHTAEMNRAWANNLQSQCRATLLNPRHVHEASVGTWEKFVLEEDRALFHQLLADDLAEWGYANKTPEPKPPEKEPDK